MKVQLNELVNIKIGLTLERKKANIASTHTITYKALTLKSFATPNATPNTLGELPSEPFIAQSEIGQQYLTKENDVIMRLRAPSQAIFINSANTGLVVSSLMASITNIFPNVLDSRYLAHYLNSKHIQQQLVKDTQGTSIPMIKIADLLHLEVSVPSLKQQQKIVAYVDAANREIELLHKLIDEKTKLNSQIFTTLMNAFIK